MIEVLKPRFADHKHLLTCPFSREHDLAPLQAPRGETETSLWRMVVAAVELAPFQEGVVGGLMSSHSAEGGWCLTSLSSAETQANRSLGPEMAAGASEHRRNEPSLVGALAASFDPPIDRAS